MLTRRLTGAIAIIISALIWEHNTHPPAGPIAITVVAVCGLIIGCFMAVVPERNSNEQEHRR